MHSFKGNAMFSTLGDNGKTIVQPLETIDDNSTETMLKNVAIGTRGDLSVCVTVSSVTVTSAPAVSVILAVSAKTGAVGALSGGAIGGIIRQASFAASKPATWKKP